MDVSSFAFAVKNYKDDVKENECLAVRCHKTIKVSGKISYMSSDHIVHLNMIERIKKRLLVYKKNGRRAT